MYIPGEYDTYHGKENMVFWALAEAHILQWLAEHDALTGKADWFAE